MLAVLFKESVFFASSSGLFAFEVMIFYVDVVYSVKSFPETWLS